MTAPRCRKTVHDRDDLWDVHGHRCTRAAVTEAGYCRQHDPELRADREARRPPTKYEQMREVADALDAAIAAIPDDVTRAQLAALLARERTLRR